MRLRGLSAAAIAVVTLLVPIVPSAATPLSAPAAATLSTASDASTAAREARSLRRDAGDLIRDYVTAYGDRLTVAERTQMDRHRVAADRHLAAVVVTTRRLSQLTRSSASPARVRAAVQAATSAHRRARIAAETSFDSARATLEPRVSLWEGLQALRDYNTMMSRFDRLGDRLAEMASDLR